MSAALDHVFVCCSVGAPEADALASIGLTEGSANSHPGQGTACRRFFFHNAYLELLWVSDAREAQAEAVLPTRLWDRWHQRGRAACPFGIVLRPTAEAGSFDPPFQAWTYRPPYLPPDTGIEIAQDAPLSEPGFFYLGSRSGCARLEQEPVTHRIPAVALTSLRISLPVFDTPSEAAAALQDAGLVRLSKAEHYLMELLFDQAVRGESADLRPSLPVILRW